MLHAWESWKEYVRLANIKLHLMRPAENCCFMDNSAPGISLTYLDGKAKAGIACSGNTLIKHICKTMT